MDNGKVHVEIGMDGKKTVSALSGSALELSVAAARILNIFYAAFCQRGIGEISILAPLAGRDGKSDEFSPADLRK